MCSVFPRLQKIQLIKLFAGSLFVIEGTVCYSVKSLTQAGTKIEFCPQTAQRHRSNFIIAYAMLIDIHNNHNDVITSQK